MNSLIANEIDAALFADGSKKSFISPIKYQPIFSDDGNVYEGRYKSYYKNDMNHEDWRIAFARDWSPYQIGKPVYLREAYACGDSNLLDDKTNKFWVFKDGSQSFLRGGYFPAKIKYTKDAFFNCKFRSPATMPRSAARTWITPTSVKCVRVRELTQKECIVLGAKNICGYDENHTGSFASLMPKGQFSKIFVAKYGQAAWNNNIYIFFYECETKLQ